MAFDRDGNWRPTNTGFGSDPTEPAETPSQTYARLNREEFADQQQRYYPFEQMSADMILDPETRAQYRQEGLDITDRNTNAAFTRAEAELRMTRSRTNQQQSARQKRSNNRLNALDRAAYGVSSRNKTNQYMDDREMELLA